MFVLVIALTDTSSHFVFNLGLHFVPAATKTIF